VNDQAVIVYDADLLKRCDYTGTPVLYPTPNRVRNGIFRYEGQLFPQVKRGRRIIEHGLVHDEPWQYQPPTILSDAIALRTWITFNENGPFWEAFPFQHRLEMVLTRSVQKPHPADFSAVREFLHPTLLQRTMRAFWVTISVRFATERRQKPYSPPGPCAL